jgi:predicted membrane protein (TIGR00267 family)
LQTPTVSRAEQRYHQVADPHRKTTWLADVVLGGQDGLVNVLGMVLGVAAATGSARVVLVAGLAAGFSGSVSMAAVAFTSTRAAADLFRSEREREYRHVEAVPHLEREEVRQIYARKGFAGELLDRIVETITSDKDVWVAIMMTEEHRLTDIDRKTSLRSAAIVGAASLVGSLLPLSPFLVLPVAAGAWSAIALAATTLFALGVYKAKVTIGHPLKSGLELAAIGTASALVGYVVGALVGAPSAP